MESLHKNIKDIIFFNPRVTKVSHSIPKFELLVLFSISISIIEINGWNALVHRILDG